jgi:hypothetical protein
MLALHYLKNTTFHMKIWLPAGQKIPTGSILAVCNTLAIKFRPIHRACCTDEDALATPGPDKNFKRQKPLHPTVIAESTAQGKKVRPPTDADCIIGPDGGYKTRKGKR